MGEPGRARRPAVRAAGGQPLAARRAAPLLSFVAALARAGGALAQDVSVRGGDLLVASPELGDPNFRHTVVLVIDHDDSGAMGIVVNRVAEVMSRDDLLAMLGLDGGGASVETSVPVHDGGPVGREYGFVLHDAGYADATTTHITDGIALSLGGDVLRAIGTSGGPRRYVIAFGYAGWGPGQLESELAEGAWVLAPAHEALVFGGAGDDAWERALAARYLDL